MAISMRHTLLTPEEAAMLAGEVKKPSWQSKNEGIHERVSFEDTIWGFDLAGGSFYKTPLRVTFVKPESRAEKAGIRPGDKLLRINDIDTSTLTIQEAHEIIIESGVHLKIAVTAPEDEEDAYFCYEDPLQNIHNEEEERRLEEEKKKKREVHAKVSSYWSLQWPWVSKRRIIYRESNCFMVPSKYEGKHKEKFPAQPFLRVEDDIVLHNKTSEADYLKQQDDIAQNKAIANDQNSTANEVNSMANGTVDNNVQDIVTDDKKDDTKQKNGLIEENPEVLENGDAGELSEEEMEEDEEIAQEKRSDDDVINQVLDNHDTMAKDDEDRILDGILSSTDDHSPENSTSNER